MFLIMNKVPGWIVDMILKEMHEDCSEFFDWSDNAKSVYAELEGMEPDVFQSKIMEYRNIREERHKEITSLQEDDYQDTYEDDYGFTYTEDGKRISAVPVACPHGNYLSFSNYYINEGVIVICEETFMGCDTLRHIHIPETVRYIGSKAFADCTNLRYVNIPEDVEYIAEDAFEGCSSLNVIRMSDYTYSENRKVVSNIPTGIHKVFMNERILDMALDTSDIVDKFVEDYEWDEPKYYENSFYNWMMSGIQKEYECNYEDLLEMDILEIEMKFHKLFSSLNLEDVMAITYLIFNKIEDQRQQLWHIFLSEFLQDKKRSIPARLNKIVHDIRWSDSLQIWNNLGIGQQFSFGEVCAILSPEGMGVFISCDENKEIFGDVFSTMPLTVSICDKYPVPLFKITIGEDREINIIISINPHSANFDVRDIARWEKSGTLIVYLFDKDTKEIIGCRMYRMNFMFGHMRNYIIKASKEKDSEINDFLQNGLKEIPFYEYFKDNDISETHEVKREE